LIGGVVALIGAFCFGELGQRRPRAGGGYVYLRETFGPLPAFLYGWTLVLVIATGAIAAVAVTFADYSLALFDQPHRFSVPLAIAAIVLLVRHQLRRRPSRRDHAEYLYDSGSSPPSRCSSAQECFSPHYRPLPSLTVPTVVSTAGASEPPLWPILFTYGGWQQTNFIAEEIVEPRGICRAPWCSA